MATKQSPFTSLIEHAEWVAGDPFARSLGVELIDVAPGFGVVAMTSSLDALWEKLCDYQIVTGKRPGIRHQSSPWYVKLILAFSGWVAACFLLAFAGSLFAWVFKSTAASFIYCAILIGVAIVTLRRGHSDFTVHLGLALSVAGQAFVLWGIVNAFDDDIRSSALLILLVEIILLLLT